MGGKVASPEEFAPRQRQLLPPFIRGIGDDPLHVSNA